MCYILTVAKYDAGQLTKQLGTAGHTRFESLLFF